MTRIKKTRKTGPLAPRSVPKEERQRDQSHAGKKPQKHKGKPAGSRHSAGAQAQQKATGGQPLDPRVGSKKPIPLVVPVTPKDQYPIVDEKHAVDQGAAAVPVTYSPEEELAMIENDERLQDFLDALDDGETLHEEDQAWVDEKLARFNQLVEILGINVDEEGDNEEGEEG